MQHFAPTSLLIAVLCLSTACIGCSTLARTGAVVVESTHRPHVEASDLGESRVLVRLVGAIREPIPYARIRFVSLETKRVWEAWTNGHGEAPFDLYGGSYAMEVEARNFGRARIENVMVDGKRVLVITVAMLRAAKYRAPDG